MSCCGQTKPLPSTQEQPAPAMHTVQFEYTGRTALSIVGPASGASYRFEQPGARMTIDYRDRASFARVPVLKQTR